MFRRITLVFTVGIGCATAGGGDAPDARRQQQAPDARVDIDARPIRRIDAGPPADARIRYDAAPGAPDADTTPDATVAYDAAPSQPDARPATPDARPSTPDAMKVCTPTTVQLLSNGGFDSSNVVYDSTSGSITTYVVTPWTDASDDYIVLPKALFPSTVMSQAGAYAAWFGGDFSVSFDFYQGITVPVGTTALHFTGYIWVGTEETSSSPFDTLNAYIGTVKLTGWDNTSTATGSWHAFDINVPNPTGFIGNTTLELKGSCDDTYNTNFFVDSLAVTATVCQ